MKVEAKKKARELREKKGLSLKEIAARLNVAKSSVSLWVRDIELTEEQRHKLIRGRHPNFIEGAKRHYEECRKQRLKYQEEGRKKVREQDPGHIAGCMLYWGEGSKDKNAAQLCNSNPGMLRVFLQFLYKYFSCSAKDVTLSVNGHTGNGLTITQLERYWTKQLGLPRKNLRKTTLNRYTHFSQKKKKGKLPYGTASVRVCRTDIVQHIYGAIQEYGQFVEPKWIG